MNKNVITRIRSEKSRCHRPAHVMISTQMFTWRLWLYRLQQLLSRPEHQSLQSISPRSWSLHPPSVCDSQPDMFGSFWCRSPSVWEWTSSTLSPKRLWFQTAAQHSSWEETGGEEQIWSKCFTLNLRQNLKLSIWYKNKETEQRKQEPSVTVKR